jgi:tRNA (cmo5U34)-methyltransferase
MKQDNLFQSGSVQEDFTFNEQVAEVFDDMLCRSVPFYADVIASIEAVLRHQASPGRL